MFKSQIYGVAQSIAETTTKLYHSKKSEMLDRVKKWNVSNLSSCNEKAAIVLKLSAIIQINASVAVKTFFDFAKLNIYNHIMNLAREFQRCDIVCDRYLNDSIKEAIRKDRCVVPGKVLLIPQNFQAIFTKTFWEMVKTKKI